MASIETTLKDAKKLNKRVRQLMAFAAVTLMYMNEAAYGQTFAEWFKQNSTQKKYLLQQVAALRIYRTYAMNGYRIARGGLGSIGDHIGQEFSVHTDHYNRLKAVNPIVSNDPQVKAIIRRQGDILKKVNLLRKTSGLTKAEEQYLGSVCSALLKDCDGQLSDLEIILKNGKLEMSDEQRLRQIGRVHDNMQDNYRFAAALVKQTSIHALERRQFTRDVNQTRRHYGQDH